MTQTMRVVPKQIEEISPEDFVLRLHRRNDGLFDAELQLPPFNAEGWRDLTTLDMVMIGIAKAIQFPAFCETMVELADGVMVELGNVEKAAADGH